MYRTMVPVEVTEFLRNKKLNQPPRGKRGVTKGERVGGDRNETLRWAWKKSHEVGR